MCLFFLGGGEGGRRRGQRKSFEGHKNIEKLMGRRGDKPIYFRGTREQTTSLL